MSTQNVAEIVAAEIQKYHAVVKPDIQSGNYGAAWAEMANIADTLRNIGTMGLLEVHSGLNCMGAAQVLCNALRASCPELLEHGEELMEKQSLDSRIKHFEAYAAQTRLPWSI
jgi:hypothetical protein